MAASGPNGPFTAIAVDGGVPTGRGRQLDRDDRDRGGHPRRRLLRPRCRRQRQRPTAAGGDRGPHRRKPAAGGLRRCPGSRRTGADRSDRHRPPLRARTRRGDRSRCDRRTRASPSRRCRRRSPAAGWSRAGTPMPSPPGTYEFRATGYDAAGNCHRLRTPWQRHPDRADEPAEEADRRSTAGFGGRRLVWQRCSRQATAGAAAGARRSSRSSNGRRPGRRPTGTAFPMPAD